MEKRCVITGLGLICAAGNDVDTCWQNICAGKPGSTRSSPSRRRAASPMWERRCTVRTSPRPNMTAPSAFFLHAAHEAVRDGRLTDSAVREAGVILAAASAALRASTTITPACCRAARREQDVLKMSASAIAANTAFALGANGETANIVNACAAGTMSVSYACDLIRLGRGEIFLAGGTDAFSSLAYAGFNALHALSVPLLSAEPQQRHLPRRGRRCSGRGGV